MKPWQILDLFGFEIKFVEDHPVNRAPYETRASVGAFTMIAAPILALFVAFAFAMYGLVLVLGGKWDD